jgi:hypothetical protein
VATLGVLVDTAGCSGVERALGATTDAAALLAHGTLALLGALAEAATAGPEVVLGNEAPVAVLVETAGRVVRAATDAAALLAHVALAVAGALAGEAVAEVTLGGGAQVAELVETGRGAGRVTEVDEAERLALVAPAVLGAFGGDALAVAGAFAGGALAAVTLGDGAHDAGLGPATADAVAPIALVAPALAGAFAGVALAGGGTVLDINVAVVALNGNAGGA